MKIRRQSLDQNSAAGRKRELFRERRALRRAFWREREQARLRVWLHMALSWNKGRRPGRHEWVAPLIEVALLGQAVGVLMMVIGLAATCFMPAAWCPACQAADEAWTIMTVSIPTGLFIVAAWLARGARKERLEWLSRSASDAWRERGEELRAELARASAPTAELARLNEACGLHRAMAAARPIAQAAQALALGEKKAEPRKARRI
jgi:hypothetical protein